MEWSLVSVAVPRPLDHLFTYKVPKHLSGKIRSGQWIKVPFGKKVTHAYVVDEPELLSDLPEDLKKVQLKEILEVGGEIPPDVMRLCQWAHDYYQIPLGEILNAAVPAAVLGLRTVKQKPRSMDREFSKSIVHTLNSEQKKVVGEIDSLSPGEIALLKGVTGSGKTEVYLELARRKLKRNKSVLILLPEIALTSQLYDRFQKGLGETVALLHSAVSAGKRRDYWNALQEGTLRVAVGARSAVFAPLKDLGLIVVDEEHDSTYKQEDRARYHARDLAIVRAKISEAVTVLGSATPSLETLERVHQKRYHFSELKNRFSDRALPQIELVDLTKEEQVEETQAPLSVSTLSAIQETLDRDEQVIVFLNRRGFAHFLTCQDCGEVEVCRNCSITLTVHKKTNRLKCHICGFQKGIPQYCGHCQSLNIKKVGAGTESLEEELPKLLKGVRISRLDRDQITSTKGLDRVLGDFREKKTNLLLGTQMLVKGHDFPEVTLVVVVLADALFRIPDFRASERAYQILKQVSGRSGRGQKPGRVLVQTYAIEHPLFKTLLGTQSEEDFIEQERSLRDALGYPPFGRMARLRFESSKKDEARHLAEQACQNLITCSEKSQKFQILGPSEAFLEKAKGIYRWDLLLKAKRIEDLSGAVAQVRKTFSQKKWSFLVDVDPSGLG